MKQKTIDPEVENDTTFGFLTRIELWLLNKIANAEMRTPEEMIRWLIREYAERRLVQLVNVRLIENSPVREGV